MKYEVNMCCDCATESYPCLGDSCSRRHVPLYQCDICGKKDIPADKICDVMGLDVCKDCAEEME